MSEWKETEFGVIPKNWEFVRACEYCSKVTDGTHDSPKRQSEGKFLITSKHIKGRKIDFGSAYLISKVDFEKINKRSYVEQWDVIVSMIGEYCGFTYVERNEIIDYAVKNVGLFKTGSKIKALWLQYYLNSTIGKYILDFNKNGSSQPYISLGSLRELPILFPPLAEQCDIVSILSSLDDKIDLLQRQNTTLEKLAETMFRQRFVEETKEDWVEKQFGYLVQPKKGKNLTKAEAIYGDYPVVAGGLEPSCYHNESNTKAPVITISASGANAGFVRLYNNPIWSSDSSYIDESITPYIYFSYVFLKLNQQQLFDKQEGSAQPHIYPTHIMNLEMLHYPEILIKNFEDEVSPMFQKIKYNQTQNQTLISMRDNLLSKLMSGEVRVNSQSYE